MSDIDDLYEPGLDADPEPDWDDHQADAVPVPAGEWPLGNTAPF